MKIKVRTGILFIGLLFAFTGCESNKSSAQNTSKEIKNEVASTQEANDELITKSQEELKGENTVIKLGDQQTDYFVFKVAEEKGFFEEEFAKDNISVERVTFSGGPAVLEALTAGEIQFGVTAVDPLINSASNGVGGDLSAVVSLGESVKNISIVAQKELGISSIEELKGHTIAVGIGTSRYNTLIAGLVQVGLTPNDVEILNLSNPDIITALQSQEADAAVISSANRASVEDIVDVIAYADDIRDNYNIVIANNSWATAHPYTTARILRVLKKTSDWIKENREETIQIFVDIVGAQKDIGALAYDTETFEVDFAEEVLKKGFQSIIDLAFEYDIIANKITADDILDGRYAELAGLVK